MEGGMNPLIGVATSIFPDLIRLIAGDKSGQLADKVANIVSSTLGTKDAGQAKAKLDSDASVLANLQQKLAELAIEATKIQNAEIDKQREDKLAEQKQANENTADARANLQDLVGIRSSIAWTAPIISYLVIGGFFLFLAILVVLYQYGPKPAPDRNDFIITIINITVGALTAAFATVVNFWLGSSAGSQNKDAAAISLQRTQSQNTKEAMDALSKRAAAPPVAFPPVVAPPTAVPQPAKVQTPTRSTQDVAQPDAQRFEACMQLIFRVEGGFSDDRDDPGGATNFGITLKTLRAWKNNDSLTVEDIKALTQNQAKEIYRTEYWNRMQCGRLPTGLDLEVFDFGVNAGPGTAVKALQKIIGVTEDGSIGPITLAALKTFAVDKLVEEYSDARLEYYKSLKNEAKFLVGWESRVSQIQTAAFKMMAGPEQLVA
jgi:Glycosyl hydrolase 108/Predicted Peptidoglycan domain